jgi:hypothetical protein
MKARLVLAVALVVGAMALGASPAVAADARAEEARRECLGTRYQHGIDLLAALYAETRDANYIYNQGRCFQQNNRPEEAISRFREYLRSADDLSPAERSDVDAQIVECERMVAEQRRRATVPPAAVGPVPVSRPAGPAPERQAGRGLRVTGAIGAALGLAGLGFGVVMGVQARSISDELETRWQQSGDFSRGRYETGQHDATLATIGCLAGGAALGAGALLYYLGARSPSTERSGSVAVALAPVLGPGLAGGRLAVRF